ncbi:hypothetical protein ALC62_10859 [Cyphomyrmex costatus]|uniref:HTH psq-type domain-containing protein n=1 Tax=Cyphomyrmex costatus TaxID=456900 RepID=A0A151IDF5_9HYME|nr:hypothetical protein ALC62_10859 [Cyphomyrmex costatus]
MGNDRVNKKRYSQKNVNDALDEIEKGMSTRKEADVFQVPKNTLIPVEERKSPFKDNKPVRHWWESFCRRFNLLDIYPSRVFNLDESAFFLISKANNVLARLFTINAEGHMKNLTPKEIKTELDNVHSPRSGRPIEAATPEIIDKVFDIVLTN